MLKGHWQIPLTQRARNFHVFNTKWFISVQSHAVWNEKKLVQDIDGCKEYIDDVVIYSDNWSDHVRQIKCFFQIMREAKLTFNLMKSKFGKATVKYFGHTPCRSRASKTLRRKISNHRKILYPHLRERTC